MVIFILSSLCFFGGLETGFAVVTDTRECSLFQAGYECYCPPDTTLACENVLLPPSPSVSSSTFGSSPVGVTQSMLQVSGGDNSANSSTNVTFKDNFLKNIQVYFMGLL